MGAIKCNTLVIKVASRCNLNCTYCYMYNMGDGTYRNQPKTMLPDTVENLLDKILEHSLENKIDKFNFVFHGGEPLLAGKQFFIDFVNRAKSRLNPFVEAHFVIQTNAVLLDDDWCQLFLDLNIHLGISLDGTEKINDMFRIDHAGKGSYSKIVDGLKIAQKEKYKKNYPGILSVININSDPVEVYNHFKQLKIFSVDFLLPEANHNTLPPAQEPDILPVYTSYGDWLIDLFDVWFNDNEVNRIDRIHIFSHIIHLILGGEVFADNIGMSDNQVLVIETDGGIEAVDALKICGEGFTKAGATVFNTSFEQALRTDLAFLYYRSSYFLSNKCNSCPVKEICGGGYLPHRYNKENGFNNESIYCEDMLKIITHIQNRIIMEIPDLILKETKSEILTYEDALSLLSDNEKNLPRSLQNEDIKFLETFKVS